MAYALHVDGISKRFRINHAVVGQRAEYRTLRESLCRLASAPIRNLRQGAALGEVEDFWALRDVHFTVDQGEVVGIIGRNGAGKSTLLKILTRITEPTAGSARLRGRIGSLLEVGTGFHPELSGRENVFLNGSILGMGRREIKQKFDEIVSFSGVDKFIDTPVKRYSSGMKVRLGFAVAAHLDLEILLIDEVLAVGDAEFQRRCLGKMGDVARSGRTVLFVSHNMPAIKKLCARSLLVDAGRIAVDGPSADVIREYLLGFGTQTGSRDVRDLDGRPGTGQVRIQRVDILSQYGEPTSSIPMGEGMTVRVELLAHRRLNAAAIQVAILGEYGQRICRVNSHDTADWTFSIEAGQCVAVDCVIPTMNLGPNRHKINVHVLDPKRVVDGVEKVVCFDVSPADVFKTGRLHYGENVLFYPAEWKLACLEDERNHVRDCRNTLL